MSDEWLTLQQYADLFRVHRRTVLKWRQEGLLTIIHVHKIIRVRNDPPKLPDSTNQDGKGKLHHS